MFKKSGHCWWQVKTRLFHGVGVIGHSTISEIYTFWKNFLRISALSGTRIFSGYLQKQEPHAEHHFANFCWGTADLEVNLLALEEGTDGLYCCPGYPSVWCSGEVQLNFSSRKVVLQLFPLKQEPTQDSVDLVTDSLSDPLFDNFCQF